MRATISTSITLLALLAATTTLASAQHFSEEDNLDPERQLHAEQARTHRRNVFNRIRRTSALAGIRRQMTERFQAAKDRALETAGEDGAVAHTDHDRAMSSQLRGAIKAGSLEKALNNMLNDPRGLMDSTTSFPECVDQTPADCIALINDEIANDPEARVLFPNGVTFDVRKKREPTDDNYNMVVIRLHQENTVKGKFGGGEVDYPFLWKYFDEQTQQVEEVELGPWDCAMLVPLSGQQCCDMVRNSVPALDVNGRHIECYFELPEEAEEDKVILVWDATTGTIVDDAIPHTPTLEETDVL
mmetsp:Transcript_2348/g.3969  ORF Transcript_2348/g.3969 Transcript_2348/m.3969 type:complete len:301 (-) Transcript_2348:185-1087(-)